MEKLSQFQAQFVCYLTPHQTRFPDMAIEAMSRTIHLLKMIVSILSVRKADFLFRPSIIVESFISDLHFRFHFRLFRQVTS